MVLPIARAAFVKMHKSSKIANFLLTFNKKYSIILIEKEKKTKRKGLMIMMNINKVIYFDMDGTLADFYGVDGWLDCLMANNPFPYMVAKPLHNLNALARRLNNLQKMGWKIGIISWLSKNSNPAFDMAVTQAKRNWLKKHLASVEFDEIKIVPYGTPKSTVGAFKGGILFDDETPNIIEWENNGGRAFNPNEIFETLGRVRKAG